MIIQRPIPDLTKQHLVFPNKYRIGDSVALATLRAWVESKHGKKDWYEQFDNTTLPILSQFIPDKPQWYNVRLICDEMGRLKEEASEFDDGNLWIWNDVFYQTGFRLDFVADSPRMEPPRILFAPLLEADYSAERCMHMRFAVELIEELKKTDDVTVLIPKDVNNVDLELLGESGAKLLSVPHLPELIRVIAHSGIYIGGDTGLSHIAGCFPSLRQIALHDRANTERHNETDFDHQQRDREYIATLSGVEGKYRSTPNKHTCHEIYFDHGGCDGVTIGKVIDAVEHELERVV